MPPTRKAGRPAAGAQIITEWLNANPILARVNRFSIVWLAVRRKGVARSAALHLDCARSAKQRGTYRFTWSIFDVAARLALAM
jgi:hypothetical protein